jgi:lipopolysaccharide/colanic/teichoic acid biosynthesis glycosyltransferase
VINKVYNSTETKLQEYILFPKTRNALYFYTKRFLDVVGALVGLLLTIPVFAILIGIYLISNDKGPIFFKQKRVGNNGNFFWILKFRTMVVNAEEKLKSDKKLYGKYVSNSYKLEPNEDPRISKVGSFLRKTSLDELPQLINVLRGEMSLVGPRPVIPEELIEYGNNVNDFLSVKPGLTGYWQVSGRSCVGYPERVNIELYYVYNQSILLDTKIILMTVWSVLKRQGAH